MENKFRITQLDPQDFAVLTMEYNKLVNTCVTYRHLALEQFAACRNSIYVIGEDSCRLHVDSIGIIGIKETTAEKLGIQWMDFYCKPDHKLYSIEFLNYPLLNTSINLFGEYIDHTKGCEDLINESLADKNDAFVAFKIHCPTGKTTDLHDALYDTHFRIQHFNPISDTYYYLRMPQIILHRVDMEGRTP